MPRSTRVRFIATLVFGVRATTLDRPRTRKRAPLVLCKGGEPAVELLAVEEQARLVLVVGDLATRGQLVEALLWPIEVARRRLERHPGRARIRRIHLCCQLASNAPRDLLEQLLEQRRDGRKLTSLREAI